jgi:hypothetical protein
MIDKFFAMKAHAAIAALACFNDYFGFVYKFHDWNCLVISKKKALCEQGFYFIRCLMIS